MSGIYIAGHAGLPDSHPMIEISKLSLGTGRARQHTMRWLTGRGGRPDPCWPGGEGYEGCCCC